MILRIRSVIICTLLFVLFLQATWFAGRMTSMMFWGISLLAIVLMLFDKGKRMRVASYKGFMAPALLFLSGSLFSILINSARAQDAQQFVASMKIWASYLVYFLFLSMTVASLSKETMEKELRTVAIFCVAICFIPFLLGTVQAFLPTIKFPFVKLSSGELCWEGRYYMLFQNPNGHSSIAFATFAMAEYLRLSVHKDKHRKWLVLFQACCFINICMCASRGTMVAVIGSWMAYEWMLYIAYRKKRLPYSANFAYYAKRLACMAVCAAVLYFSCNIIPTVIPVKVQESVAGTVLPVKAYASDGIEQGGKEYVTRDYFEHGSDISNHRFSMWLYAVKTVPRSPVYGVGIYTDDFISCHNVFFTVMLSYGFLGLGAYICLLLYVWKMACRRCRECAELADLKKYGTLTCCMVGILVIGLTNDVLIFAFEFVNIIAYYLMGFAMRSQKEGAVIAERMDL